MYYYEGDSYVNQMMDPPKRVYIITTGAGAGLQRRLWEVPGSSSFLVGAEFPYARDATERAVGFSPAPVNTGTALELAIAAYLKADDGDRNTPTIGLGMTCSVATLQEHKGQHRIHAAVVSRDAVYATDVYIHKSGPEGRKRDGLIADSIGFDLLLVAMGIVPLDKMNNRPLSEGQTRDAQYEARGQFMEYPLVLRNGARMKAPSEAMKTLFSGMTLFPGNFNPPHEGHFENARNADPETIFQVSASPPHKPALSLQDMLERVLNFRGRGHVLFSENGSLYIDKARHFPNSTFILGTDALRRMLDPKWGIETESLLREFESLGTRFRVSERTGDSLRDIMVRDSLIPVWAYGMFECLPRTEFASLSSTQRRQETDES